MQPSTTPTLCRARSAGPCSEMPVPGSVRFGRISAISQAMPARLSATPSVMPAMPAPTIKTLAAAAISSPSDVEAHHPPLGIARALDRAGRHGARDLGKLRVGELHAERADILHQPLLLLGARDRGHVIALRQHPGERKLGRCAALALGNGLD